MNRHRNTVFAIAVALLMLATFGANAAAAPPVKVKTYQSVLLPHPANGIYDMWIASDPDPSYDLHPSIAYEALAEVEYAPTIQPIRQLLPDLESRGTRTFTFNTPSFPLFEPDPPGGASCFSSEAVVDGAQTCLRYDQIIANVGEAPLELRFAIPKDPNNTSTNLFQRVFSSNGSHADQPAGLFEYHETHHHYHYLSFASATMWTSNPQGQKLETDPIRNSEQVSSCIADFDIDIWKQKGDGPRRYMDPACLTPQASDANFDYLIHGLTNGWSDVHPWYLPDQYIEVTGVPNGYYLLEFCADPDHEIAELDETNNCSKNLIQLKHMGTPQKTVINLGPKT